MRRGVVGAATGIGAVAAIGLLLVPARSHLSIATVGLVLVVPVVAAVVVGGYPAGIASVAAGFLVFDYVYIPPYYTLVVGAGQNWAVLGVYVAVMLLVARVVGRLQVARAEAQRRADETRRLFELSELLVTDRSTAELLASITETVRTVFDLAGVTLLLPGDGTLRPAATSGEPLRADQLQSLDPVSGLPVMVGSGPDSADRVRAVPLATGRHPVGLLALTGAPVRGSDSALLQTFANHAALAIERSQLRAQALRSELLEEVDRIRQALLGAVSHDLRTPLATMKVASSTLLDPAAAVPDDVRTELYELLDGQTDRLTRLVTGLLDMTRFQSGALLLDASAWPVLDLAGEAVAGLRASLGDRPVGIDVAEAMPEVWADRVLVGQVLVNLIDNADRHAPAGTPITVAAGVDAGRAWVAVSDRGPGVPAAERDEIFERFVRFDTGGRAGLGLWIARAFVEAHGERIEVDDAAGGGARFVFTLPLAGAVHPRCADDRVGGVGGVGGVGAGVTGGRTGTSTPTSTGCGPSSTTATAT